MRKALLQQDCGSKEPVLTPQADVLYPVLGPVVTAHRYPITSFGKVKTALRASSAAGRKPNKPQANELARRLVTAAAIDHGWSEARAADRIDEPHSTPPMAIDP